MQSGTNLTVNQGVAGSSSGGQAHYFVEIWSGPFSDPSADSRRAVISYWRKNWY